MRLQVRRLREQPCRLVACNGELNVHGVSFWLERATKKRKHEQKKLRIAILGMKK